MNLESYPYIAGFIAVCSLFMFLFIIYYIVDVIFPKIRYFFRCIKTGIEIRDIINMIDSEIDNLNRLEKKFKESPQESVIYFYACTRLTDVKIKIYDMKLENIKNND